MQKCQETPIGRNKYTQNRSRNSDNFNVFLNYYLKYKSHPQ